MTANSCGSFVGERKSYEMMLVQPCECNQTATELCTQSNECIRYVNCILIKRTTQTGEAEHAGEVFK